YVSVERAESLSSRHGAQDLRNLVLASQALSELPLAPHEAAAVRAHRRHVAGKAKLREFLDVKRARGPLAAAGLLARAPLSAPYVLSRAVSDALRGGSRKRPAPPVAPAPYPIGAAPASSAVSPS